jgi:hypothetical protein
MEYRRTSSSTAKGSTAPTTYVAAEKTTVETKGGQVVVYSGDNFSTWARTAEIALHVVRAWGIVQGDEDPPVANASAAIRKDFQDRNSAAVEILSTSLRPEYTSHIMESLRGDDPAGMWGELQKLNRNANVGHSGRLKAKFYSSMWDPRTGKLRLGNLPPTFRILNCNWSTPSTRSLTWK